MGNKLSAGVGRSVGVLLLVVSMGGCTTLSESVSDSVSTSVSSPFKFSSGSSSGSSSEQKDSYQGDLRKYAEVCARSACGVDELIKGVAAVAEKHGISNWEADMTSYSGIGEGFGKARLLQPQLDIYKNSLARGDAAKAAAIQKGYEQGR